MPPSTRPELMSRGPMRADVEAADAVLAAQEQLLEDRQLLGVAVGLDVLAPGRGKPSDIRGVLAAEADAFERRLEEVGVAAEAGEVDRRRQPRPVVGKIGWSTVL